MSINFLKNSSSLLTAYNDVLDPKSDKNWYSIAYFISLLHYAFTGTLYSLALLYFRVIFSYEGSSSILKVEDTGSKLLDCVLGRFLTSFIVMQYFQVQSILISYCLIYIVYVLFFFTSRWIGGDGDKFQSGEGAVWYLHC